jgi:N-acyl homoserine lactone hydrolase
MPTLALDDVHRMLLATLVWPPGTPRAGRSIPVYAYAIRHPRGLVLFDTGVGSGSGDVDREWRPTLSSLKDALAAIGQRAADVVGIACCHLHFDHCGQNPRFPGVPIYAQEAEYEATRQRDYTVPEWVDFPGADYHLLKGDAEPWRGIHLLSTPGHTPGHQSVLVNTDAGDVLLAGQAVYDLAELEGRAALESTDAAYVGSVERLRSLNPRRIYVSHDARIADALTTR